MQCKYIIPKSGKQCQGKAIASKNSEFCMIKSHIETAVKNIDSNIAESIDTMAPQVEYTNQDKIEIETKLIPKSIDEILDGITSIKRSFTIKNKKTEEYVHSRTNLYLLIRVLIEKKHQFFWCYNRNDAESFISKMHDNRYECHEVLWSSNCKFFCDIDLIMPMDMRSKLLKQMPEDELFGSIVDAYEQAINKSLKSHNTSDDVDFAIIKRCRETDKGYKYSIHLISTFWMPIRSAKELAKDAMDQIDSIDTKLDRKMLKDAFDLQPYKQHGSLSLIGGWKGEFNNRLHAQNWLNDSYISLYNDMCDLLDEHAYPTNEPVPGMINDQFIKEALMHVKDIPDWSDAFDLDASSLKGNTMIIKRDRASNCSICDRVHDSDNTMLLSFNGASGCAFWKCMHSVGKKAKLFYKRISTKINNWEPPILEEESKSLIPAIFDKNNPCCFMDSVNLSKLNVVSRDQAYEFIKRNIAYISNGANGFFMTKSISENGIIDYARVSINGMQKALTFFKMSDSEGHISMKQLNDVLISSIHDITYGKLDFIPYGCKSDYDWTDRKIFNCFSGFMHDRQPDFQIDHSLINGYLDHIKDVWCAGNEALYEATIKQFAHFVQKPNVKTQTCLVAMGREGCGKNRPIDLLSKHVLGSQYIAEVSKMDKVVGRFNAMLENKLLCVLNEASDCSSQESLSNQDKLKDLITNESIVIERKGVDPYTIADICNYICFSNNHYVIKASTEMRRFVFYEVSDCHMGDHEYFQRLTDDFEKRNAGIHLYHYLMSIDISNFVPQRDFPQTAFKAQMQSDAISRDGQWLIAYCNEELQSNCSPFEGFNSSISMLEKLNGWLVSQGYNSTWNQDKLGRFLKKLNIESGRNRIDGIRVRGFIINRDELKDKLSIYFRRDDLFPADC